MLIRFPSVTVQTLAFYSLTSFLSPRFSVLQQRVAAVRKTQTLPLISETKPPDTGLFKGTPGTNSTLYPVWLFFKAKSKPPWMCLKVGCWGSPWPLRTAFSPALWTSCWSSSSVLITSTSWRSSSSWPAAPRRSLSRFSGGWGRSRSRRSASNYPR